MEKNKTEYTEFEPPKAVPDVRWQKNDQMNGGSETLNSMPVLTQQVSRNLWLVKWGALWPLFFALCLPVKSASANDAVPVFVQTVKARTITEQIKALGTTTANESVYVTVDSPEKISEIHFTEGQQVTAGELLVSLSQQQEQAQLRAALALLEEAKLAYERAVSLSEKKAVSAATVQERRAALSREQSSVAVLEARLAELSVTAPFSGVLGLRQVSVGSLVKPGDTITTLDDLSKIKLDFSVPSRYLAVLEPGLVVRGQVQAFGDQLFEGKVIGLNPRVDPVTRTVSVRALFENQSQQLKPGLLMSVVLIHNQHQGLMLPEEALVRMGENSFVFVVNTTDQALQVQQRNVKVGLRLAGEVEITEGLNEGEQVVVHGVNKLRAGAGVLIKGHLEDGVKVQELLTSQPTVESGG